MKYKIGIALLTVACLALGHARAQEKGAEDTSVIKEKYDLAVDYFLKKDHKNAHNAFARIVDDVPVPYKAIVYFNMGMCLQIDGIEQIKIDAQLSDACFTQASEYYQEAQDILPYFPQLYSNAGLVAFYQKRPESEVKKMTAFGQQLTDELGAFPPDIDSSIYSYRSYEAMLSIAVNYIRDAKFRDAANMLKEIINKMRESPPKKNYMFYTAYNSLGLSLFGLNDIQGAIDAYENSIKVAPDQPKLDLSYSNLGMLYFTRGDYAKAKDAIARSLAINPNNGTALEYQKKLKGS